MTPEYLAGFFDGEGCVTHTRRESRSPIGVRLLVSQRDREVLDEIQAYLGCGRVNASAGGRAFRLQIAVQSDVRRVIPLIYRHSIVKREQLRVAWDILNSPTWEREELALQLRQLKRR